MRADYKELDNTKKILVTGGAGFIGFHLSKALLEEGCTIVGFDNMNHYYDVSLKEERLKILREYENIVSEKAIWQIKRLWKRFFFKKSRIL